MSAGKRLRLVEEVVVDGEVVSVRSIPFFREHLRPIFRRRLEGEGFDGPPIPVAPRAAAAMAAVVHVLAQGRDLGVRGAGGAAAYRIDEAVAIISRTFASPKFSREEVEAAAVDPALLHELRVARKLGIDLDPSDLFRDNQPAPSGAPKKKGTEHG